MKIHFDDTLSEIIFYLAIVLFAVNAMGKVAYEFGESISQAIC